MDLQQFKENDEQRIHGSDADACGRCARDVDRTSGWVRVQQALLRDGSRDDAGRRSARTASPEPVLPTEHRYSALELKRLLHKAEVASASLRALEMRGPTISQPHHDELLREKRIEERRAWETFKIAAGPGVGRAL